MKNQFLFLVAMTAAMNANSQTINLDGHQAADLGLSVYWATTNLGATTPEAPGDYFLWGVTEPIAKNQEPLEAYHLDDAHDAAIQIWGGKWRLPTVEEFQELQESCDWTWNDEKKGYDVKNKNNSTSIFLPAAGYNGLLFDEGIEELNDRGYYWSSTTCDYGATTLDFNSGNVNSWFCGSGWAGFSIRPVYEKPSPTALKNILQEKEKVTKTLENGQIIIHKNGEKFTVAGQKL